MAQELDEWAPPTLTLQPPRHTSGRGRTNPLAGMVRLAILAVLGSHRRH